MYEIAWMSVRLARCGMWGGYTEHTHNSHTHTQVTAYNLKDTLEYGKRGIYSCIYECD